MIGLKLKENPTGKSPGSLKTEVTRHFIMKIWRKFARAPCTHGEYLTGQLACLASGIEVAF